jgi:hypothetical protein
MDEITRAERFNAQQAEIENRHGMPPGTLRRMKVPARASAPPPPIKPKESRRAPLPQDKRNAALKLAHDILKPMVADGWFGDVLDEQYRRPLTQLRIEDACAAIERLPDSLSHCRQYILDALRFQHWKCLVELFPEGLSQEARAAVANMKDLPEDLRKFTDDALTSTEKARSGKIPGTWSPKIYHAHIAAAVRLVAVGFDIHEKRNDASRDKEEKARESASTIVTEALNALLKAQNRLNRMSPIEVHKELAAIGELATPEEQFAAWGKLQQRTLGLSRNDFGIAKTFTEPSVQDSYDLGKDDGSFQELLLMGSGAASEGRDRAYTDIVCFDPTPDFFEAERRRMMGEYRQYARITDYIHDHVAGAVLPPTGGWWPAVWPSRWVLSHSPELVREMAYIPRDEDEE